MSNDDATVRCPKCGAEVSTDHVYELGPHRLLVCPACGQVSGWDERDERDEAPR